MNGLFPPSSSDSFLPLPAVRLRMMRPTSVDPGERDLVDVRVLDDSCAGLAVAGHDVEHARGNPRLARELGEERAR